MGVLICQEEMEPVRPVAGLEQEEEWAGVEEVVEEDEWEEPGQGQGPAVSVYALHAARRCSTGKGCPATIYNVPSAGIQWSRDKKIYSPGIDSHLEDSVSLKRDEANSLFLPKYFIQCDCFPEWGLKYPHKGKNIASFPSKTALDRLNRMQKIHEGDIRPFPGSKDEYQLRVAKYLIIFY